MQKEQDSGLEDFGAPVLAMADALAEWSETAEGLTCTYLSPAHRAVANRLREWMQGAGLAAWIDAAGNVVGRLPSIRPGARTLIIGSHYDTVRNAGKYDGRLGILVGIAAVDELRRRGVRLPFNLELIGFGEEEGVRFARPYLCSGVIAGRFDPNFLEQRDVDGRFLGDVMREAGLDPAQLPHLARKPEELLGYLEVHIEQGPVLLEEDLPVGVVNAISGTVRHRVTVTGKAGHAGTVPMPQRHDAGAAAAEMILAVERRCAQLPQLVGTVGMIEVPDSAINVIPGQCEFTIDIRAPNDHTRDEALDDCLAEFERIGAARGVTFKARELFKAPAVACERRMQSLLREAVVRAGIRPRYLPSGAGHDAVMFDGVTDIGMLFVRCGNEGISHSPLESVIVADVDVAVRVLVDALINLGSRDDVR